jgi:hypothetical protein
LLSWPKKTLARAAIEATTVVPLTRFSRVHLARLIEGREEATRRGQRLGRPARGGSSALPSGWADAHALAGKVADNARLSAMDEDEARTALRLAATFPLAMVYRI